MKCIILIDYINNYIHSVHQSIFEKNPNRHHQLFPFLAYFLTLFSTVPTGIKNHLRINEKSRKMVEDVLVDKKYFLICGKKNV